MNPFLDSLLPYPFERMNALKTGLTSRSNAPHIALSIGEPKHAAAPFLVDAATDANFVRPGLGTYPATRGSESLRNAGLECPIARPLEVGPTEVRRFDITTRRGEFPGAVLLSRFAPP